jgi:hypothetical protein
MATIIKISNKSKEKLERLRARLILQGRKLKQDEIIDFSFLLDLITILVLIGSILLTM